MLASNHDEAASIVRVELDVTVLDHSIATVVAQNNLLVVLGHADHVAVLVVRVLPIVFGVRYLKHVTVRVVRDLFHSGPFLLLHRLLSDRELPHLDAIAIVVFELHAEYIERSDVHQHRFDATVLVIIRDREELLATILHNRSVEKISVYPEITDAFQHTKILVVFETKLRQLFAIDVDFDAGYTRVTIVLITIMSVIHAALAAEFNFLILYDAGVVFVFDAHLKVWFVDVDAAH